MTLVLPTLRDTIFDIAIDDLGLEIRDLREDDVCKIDDTTTTLLAVIIMTIKYMKPFVDFIEDI